MICVNPELIKICIPVGTSTVILTVRPPSDQEQEKFIKGRYQHGRGGKFKDNSWSARIKFMNSILIGIEAKDENGVHEEVTYLDPETKENRVLTPEVPDWIKYVTASWKYSAAIQFEEITAEIEEDVLKN